jgi:hypothetical protein
MSPEEWSSIPICGGESEAWNSTQELKQTCSNEAISCGRSVFNISTVVDKSIDGNGSKVPVIGGGREDVESSIVIHGCRLPEFKCQVGFSKKVKHPFASQAEGGAAKTEEITVKNSFTSCGHCESHLCNTMNSKLPTEDLIHRPSSSPSSVGQIAASILLCLGAGLLSTI